MAIEMGKRGGAARLLFWRELPLDCADTVASYLRLQEVAQLLRAIVPELIGPLEKGRKGIRKEVVERAVGQISSRLASPFLVSSEQGRLWWVAARHATMGRLLPHKVAISNEWGGWALGLGALYGDAQAVATLLRAGLSFHPRAVGFSLRMAALHGREEVVRLLFESRVPIPVTAQETALFNGATYGHAPVVRHFIPREGELAQEVMSLALLHAVEGGHAETVRLLCRESARIPGAVVPFFLGVAAESGHRSTVRALLEETFYISPVHLDSAIRRAEQNRHWRISLELRSYRNGGCPCTIA
jgi:hypothetical protein